MWKAITAAPTGSLENPANGETHSHPVQDPVTHHRRHYCNTKRKSANNAEVSELCGSQRTMRKPANYAEVSELCGSQRTMRKSANYAEVSELCGSRRTE